MFHFNYEFQRCIFLVSFLGLRTFLFEFGRKIELHIKFILTRIWDLYSFHQHDFFILKFIV
jgi:hypothetical protein